MKRLIILLLNFSIVAAGFSQSWIQKSDYPGVACDDGTSFTIGNKAYCGTGMTPWFSTTTDFYSFDLVSEIWTNSTPLPTGMERQYAVGLSDQSFGYLFGGTGNGVFYNDLWKFDPATAVWTQLSSMPDSGRSGSTGFIINDTIYIVGGTKTMGGAIADVWAYSINDDSWEQKNDLRYTIWTAKSTSVNGKGYLTFGMTDNGRFPENLLEYIPQTDSWIDLPPYPETGHSHGSMVSSGNFLLTIGGRDSLGVYSKYLHRYDINNQTWQQLSAIPDSDRKGGMVFIKDEKLYYTTGITATNTRLKQTWKCTDALIGNQEYEISKWKVYPNPLQDKLRIEIEESYQFKETHLVLTDIQGKVWMEQAISGQKSMIDMSALPQGLYFASLKGSGHFGAIKLLKTH
ncbi:kelch repeat-containing protein [Owenweeksia hongkongensis]|uniref:Kelch repeat-containing protein n=1 Tax=Owenweeksia hongkongensis TaxID=253245 RepID=UPI003A8F7617